jgi:hypothetical protein
VKNAGFFGRVLSIKIDGGSWIFDGTTQECQRPSWNYNRAEGGGIALDMMAHWRYMIDTFEKQTDQIALPMFKPTGSKRREALGGARCSSMAWRRP